MHLRNVYRYQLALGTESGTDEMFVSSGGSTGSSSLLKPTGHLSRWPDVSFEKKIRVKVMSLDDWATVYGVGGIDLIWLDLQGMELKVLKSGQRMLKSVQAIHAEVSVRELYAGDAPLHGLIDFLEYRGFQIHTARISNGFGNVLFNRG
jgi:FkbM family methyltransferase